MDLILNGKPENSFYLELFLHVVYLALSKFLMFKEYDCPSSNVPMLDLHVGDFISLKRFQ